MAHSAMLSWFSRSRSTAIPSKANYIDSFISPENSIRPKSPVLLGQMLMESPNVLI